jgi:hypothetical protein
MQTITDFLIDISDNMKDRMSIAQQVLSDEIIPSYDFSEPFGMRTFLSIAKSPIVINSIDLGLNSKNDFLERVKKLPLPNGGSPIAYTIQKSVESLTKNQTPVKRIVLVTAGIDTDGKSYGYEIEKGYKDNSIQVNILGIGLSDSEENAASKAAESSNGCFCNIPIDATASRIKEIISPLINKLNEKDIQPLNDTPLQQEEKVSAAPSATIPQQQKEQQKEKADVKTEKVPEQKIVKEDERPVKSVVDTTVEIPQIDISSFAASFENNNNSITELLKKNADDFRKIILQEQQAKKEIERLNVLSERAALELEQLNKKYQEIQSEIETLKQQEKEVVIIEDEAYKRAISRKSETLLFEHLEKKYPKRVKWINQDEKKNVGYDFEVVHFDSNSVEYYIACKGVVDDSKTFYLNRKEWEMCLKDNLHYQVYLVLNIESNPTFIIIDNLMGWILNGKVIPCAEVNKKVKAGQAMFTLVD